MIRCAQSRGEWPGARRTFLEGRDEGERVDEEAGIGKEGRARDREGGARRDEATDGGGRRAVFALGTA